MPVGRQGHKQIPLNITGSSVYGIDNKISIETTYNMYISDEWMVPYPGYKIGIPSSEFNDATRARGLYASSKTNDMFAVFDDGFYKINLFYDHVSEKVTSYSVALLGTLESSTGVVYISENNKPQILLSDGIALYVYDSSLTQFSANFTASSGAKTPTDLLLTFSPGITLGIGEAVVFSGSGTLPTGLVAGTTYYAIPVATNGTTYNMATTPYNAYQGIYIKHVDDGSGILTLSTLGPFQTPIIDFTPGYITFHDTYFICAASQDNYYAPPANNTWRLSQQEDGTTWPDAPANIGLLQTKPDNTRAVVRFPSKGNMILVMGDSVTEFWFDLGAQLFPYQRTNQGSIDYGCVNPATVASMGEHVIWLAQNEKSGPIIMFSTGGTPEKVTTDGIDFQLSQLNTPEDSQGFLYRKNGHLFYHLNFYTDNISFVVDLTTNKIYNASDARMNYYSMGQVVWYNNQYFAISKDNANLFIFDTVFTTYEDVLPNGQTVINEIPRIRTCRNIRLPSQDYFIANDVGFTISTGNTDYEYQDRGPIFLTTENGNKLITQGSTIFLTTQDGKYLVTQDGDNIISTNVDPSDFKYLISTQNDIVPITPRVDFSVSYDGGYSFSNDFPYVLPGIGQRRNRLMWWQIGMVNDMVCQFKFWGIGSVFCTDGVVNIR